MSIPVFSLESSRAQTELCVVGAHCGTDKSPYNTNGHRHPYTAFYSSIFAPYKNKPIRFAEIGVAGGASVNMWHRYFSNSAQLVFFDRDQNFLNNSQNYGLQNTSFHLMDVADDASIRDSLQKAGGNFDIILDDSSHDCWNQKKIIAEMLPFLKPGGIFIIEDVFRDIENQMYMNFISPYLDQLAFYGFYEMEHSNKWSPGWNNDKILMLVKN